MSDELCILCGKTKEGNDAHDYNDLSPTQAHTFRPPSKMETQVFLSELHRRARDYGWSGDFHEIHRFVEQQYADAGFVMPKMEPTE